MCQTLHNILKSFAYDAIPATPAFCVQIQSDVQRPSDGGIDRLASLPPSLPPSLSFSPSASLSPSFSLSLAFCAVGGCQAVDRLLVSVGPGVLSSSFSQARSSLVRSWTRRNRGAHDHGVTITFTTTLYFVLRGAGSGGERTKIIITKKQTKKANKKILLWALSSNYIAGELFSQHYAYINLTACGMEIPTFLFSSLALLFVGGDIFTR